jgi:hypothetical protein
MLCNTVKNRNNFFLVRRRKNDWENAITLCDHHGLKTAKSQRLTAKSFIRRRRRQTFFLVRRRHVTTPESKRASSAL